MGNVNKPLLQNVLVIDVSHGALKVPFGNQCRYRIDLKAVTK